MDAPPLEPHNLELKHFAYELGNNGFRFDKDCTCVSYYQFVKPLEVEGTVVVINEVKKLQIYLLVKPTMYAWDPYGFQHNWLEWRVCATVDCFVNHNNSRQGFL